MNRIQCPRCHGTGRVRDHEEPFLNEDGKMPCPCCEGDGRVSHITFQKLSEIIRGIFANATIDEDLDGQIVIHTGLHESKNGMLVAMEE